jgi:hypothetical protein
MESFGSYPVGYNLDGVLRCIFRGALVLGNSQRVADLCWLRRVPVVCLGQEFS